MGKKKLVTPASAYREVRLLGPAAAMADAVWESRHPGGGLAPKRVLPDCCADLIFDLSGQRGPWWVGTMTRPLLVSRTSPAHYIGVRFRPGWASLMIGSLAGLADNNVSAAALGQKDAARLARRLGGAKKARERLSLLSAWLNRLYLKHAPKASPALQLVDSLYQRPSAALPVSSWAEEVGVGRRQLERIFLNLTGVSPRTFRSLLRFHGAVRALRPGVKALDAALTAGYYDQPHFTREFKRYSGLTPARFLMSH